VIYNIRLKTILINFIGCNLNYVAVIPAATAYDNKNRWFSLVLTARTVGRKMRIDVDGCDTS